MAGAAHHQLSPVHQRLVQEWEAKPSLFELVKRWLERTPFLSFGDFDFWQSYRVPSLKC
ncbi:MAG: hypothetical protein RMI34_11995 [Chloroherpetonaceae bacterium]|nr:hypothetical protein [Chloroherpetonaceae bacterium]